MSNKNKKVIDKDEQEQITNEEHSEVKKRRLVLRVFIFLFLILALTYIYARYLGTRDIMVREYNIINENIPISFDGFSIAHFSDLELGTTFNISDLKELVKKINDLKPDIVVFTGDIVKGYKTDLSDEDKQELITEFKKIDPLIGKYSVAGDDDRIGTLYNEVMDASGFMDLSNKYELIYYKGLVPIVLYGLDSMLTGTQDFTGTFSYPSDLDDVTYMPTYRILLAHEPDTALNVLDYNISLMLSGHSHNSEINIPYLKNLYNIRGASTYFDEYHKQGNTDIYVSSGLGTSKYKVRLFSKPSISFYRLYTN